jgi:chromosome segregation ATPase
MHMSTAIETVFYVLSTVGLIAAAVGFARRKYREARERWQAESDEKAQLSRALENNADSARANAAANTANTEALGKLGAQLGAFIGEVHDSLTRHSHALDDHGHQLSSHQRSLDNHDWRLGMLERNVEQFHGVQAQHTLGEEPPAAGLTTEPEGTSAD